MTWNHPALAQRALDEGDKEISRLKFQRDVAVAALREIKRAVVEGRVCDDVAWFDQIETLYDFCDRILDRVSGGDVGKVQEP